jgi:DNA-binding GntR family transcriptional regulator
LLDRLAIQAGREMEHLTLSVHEGFDRLQRRLVAMHIGETIRPAEAAEETGLSVEVCRAVFTGLERAGLMTTDHNDCFTRSPLDLAKSSEQDPSGA